MRFIKDLELFVHTAETGSLSAAARLLDLTPAAASAALKRLEAELDTPLVVRSTRSLRLTHEGELFLRHCRQALQLLADGKEAVQTGRALVRGVLQVSVPSDFGRNLLLPWLDRFQAQYPEVRVRLQLSDRIADIYRQPVDIALRYGAPADSSFIALPLAPANHRVLCAAPAYLARAGTPTSPAQLADHNCLCFMLGEQTHDRWRFSDGERQLSVIVNGDRLADDGDAVRRWALAGRGIAYKSLLDVVEDLRSGRLVRLCTDWQGEAAPLNLICPDRRQLNPAVQALREFLAAQCEALLR
ncbi:LysR family transcriptional regulator [Marinobacterium arenosum]|uniref:LysR family transcriptional regulator n=1 Tax=Marinobacterium arenosum TaxID=2862496 RepID=UPI001C9388F7|nr:LysR family transcriptional regulator [Marinobacterium arenosum]MBY4676913.1 LysR family transcriptional regulator [Marinobacterium arenosum]